MSQHFWNLVWRSFIYMPSIISQNWAGILLPLAVFSIREGVRIKREGWGTVNWRDVRRDSAYMICAYVILFGWAVVHTVYSDHEYLVGFNSELQNEVTASRLVVPKLGGWINISSLKNSPDGIAHLLLIQGLITNQGAPTVITEWAASVRMGNGNTVQGNLLIAPSRPLQIMTAERSKVLAIPQDYWPINAPDIPIPTGGSKRGWIYAEFPNVSDKYLTDSRATVVLAVADVNGKWWTIEQPVTNQNRLSIYTLEGVRREK